MVLHWRVHVLLLLVSVSILPQFNNAFHACNNNRLKRTHANSITTDQQYAYSFRPNSLSILPSSSTSSNTSSETSRVQIKSFSSISKITDDESYHGIQKKDEYDNENVVVDNNNQNADVDQNINQNQDQDRRQQYQSYIESIRCQNFMLNATNSDEENNNEVTIDLGNEGPNLVAVTGETGSGKSLLVFKVFQLIVGEKASIVRGSSSACGEVVVKLGEPHLSHTKYMMKALGLAGSNISNMIPMKNGFGELRLKRTILQSTTNVDEGNTKKKIGRIRSKCEINGKQVTLKILRTIAKSLITTVDASVASSALSQGKARIAIVDTGVSNHVLSKVKEAKKLYRDARKRREDVEFEIKSRVMPASFTPTDGEENMELLQHWIDELDEFQTRLSTFQDSIISSRGTAELLNNHESDEMIKDNNSINGSMSKNGSSFVEVLKKFANCSWKQDEKNGQEQSIDSSFYSNLLDLRDGVKHLDSQLVSAHASCDALSALSSAQSVAFALEESRRHLFDATTGFEDNEALNNAAESSHELLNKLEDALSTCASFMSDNPKGLLSTLESMRQSIHVSVDDIDFLIADWGSLARKHGVSTFSLPPLHHSLRQELSGDVEARLKLPKAKAEERVALDQFEDACKALTQARLQVCSSLTHSVTSRLEHLGMEGSTFTSHLNGGIHKCTDSCAYSDGTILGIDSVDFLLKHRNMGQEGSNKEHRETSNNNEISNLEIIGSSGEKARLLLAIETDLPGSVGASCNSLNGNNGIAETTDYELEKPGPVTVVYDEIDAHVGGRAAVSLAKLLADQSRYRENENPQEAKRNQVVSITHSPSLAAIADRHIVVQKVLSNGKKRGKDSVMVNSVRGLSRLQEISRMASGDLAIKESIQFAEALLRDGVKYKQSKQ